uniref:Uncharacterized protein n=1 Tax=Cucumis melo TaxID=3656 RepID=A0A9I9DM16_CUCME
MSMPRDEDQVLCAWLWERKGKSQGCARGYRRKGRHSYGRRRMRAGTAVRKYGKSDAASVAVGEVGTSSGWIREKAVGV